MISFGLCTILVLLAGGLSYYFGKITIENYRKISLKNLPATQLTEAMKNYAKDLRSYVNRIGLADNSLSELETLKNKISELGDKYEQATIEYTALTFEAEEKVLFDKVSELWIPYFENAKRIAEARSLNTKEGLLNYSESIRGSFRQQANGYFDAVSELTSYHRENARTNREKAEVSNDLEFKLTFGIMIVCLVFSTMSGVYSKNQVSVLIGRISQSLDQSVLKVSDFSHSINTISSELSDSSRGQASAVQQTTSAITQISAALDKTSESTKLAKTTSEQSQIEVGYGKEAIDSLGKSLGDLSKALFNMVEKVNENNKNFDGLVDVINEIESKTKVINEIVFQTKLLSFNASVEAARAGEAGKGFAVVAEEVGSLARLSGTAAEEISDLLSRSITTVEKMVNESKSSMSLLVANFESQQKEVSAKITVCNAAFEEINRSTKDVAMGMESIQASIGEQNLGMQEIMQAMQEISVVTDQNAEHSRKSSVTASELQRQVLALDQAIENLKIGKIDMGSNEVQNSV